MKIAFVNILYSLKDGRGGLGTHIADLSQELSRLGHDVTVITSGVEKPYQENGVTVVQLGKVERYSHSAQLLNPINLIQRLLYMLRLTSYVRKSKFDVVEAAEGGFEQLFLVLLKTCAVVTKLHGNFRFIYGNQSLLARLVERFEAFVVRKSDAVYTSSLAYAESLSKAYQVPLEEIRIIPCGINLEELNTDQALDPTRSISDIKNRKVIFLAVGNSPARKGAHLLIEAAGRVSPDDFLFVLSSSRTEFPEATKMPSNLLVLPNLARAEFYSWIKRADLMVFPSEFESFAIAVREAMLLKKAIVVSRNIPLEEIETAYPRCIVLAKNDVEHLLSAIGQVKNEWNGDREIKASYLEALRNKYDLRRVAEATLDLYRGAQEKFGNRSPR